MNTSRKLLVLEAGLEGTRKFWLENLVEGGYNLDLCQPWVVSWEKPYIREYLRCSFSPWSSAEREKIAVFCRQRGIQAILCLNEGTVPYANDLCKDLGFPPLCAGDASKFRNKKKMRDSIGSGRIRQPCYVSLTESDVQNLPDLSYPLIVKPTEMMASLGVFKVHNKRELQEAVQAAFRVDFVGEDLRRHYGLKTEVIVEEYVEGEEFSVESIVQSGKLLLSRVTKKVKCVPPYFDELGHITNPALSEHTRKALEAAIEDVHLAMQIQNAITHCEIRIRGNEIYLMEIGLRPGGDLIPLIHSLASGIPFWEVAAHLALGESVSPLLKAATKRAHVAVFFPYVTPEKRELPCAEVLHGLLSEAGVEILLFKYKKEEAPAEINPGLWTQRMGTILFSASDYGKIIAAFERLERWFPGMEFS